MTLLGTHIRGRSDCGARLREMLCLGRARDSKIHHDRLALLVDHDVGRLDIAMNHALAMRVIQRARDFGENRLRHRNRKCLVLRQHIVERAPVDVLHDEIQKAVFLFDGVDIDDVRMIELGGGSRLCQKPIPHPLAICEPRQHHLDRHASVQLEIVREENRRHPAAAKLAFDLVFAQGHGAKFLEQLDPRVVADALAADQRRAGDGVAAGAAEPVARRDGRSTACAGNRGGDRPEYRPPRGEGEGSAAARPNRTSWPRRRRNFMCMTACCARR